ncbi:alpha/beta hydrolase fold domain-containing protein [Streptomyces broussonetiae]|uniref:Alpha/beta hydrolase fold domain-containing protein n=1 Tax=Streptomyces broussonetiae TaxID=2686304 RepID=A0A6I6MPM8_9ACTN|nr:alpha/beta hydrolase [Streptomyces broussonetiae]QHA02183.1 alpha/beta hydrolase fold domain-containing protein [Streptomyces broussonetiae]
MARTHPPLDPELAAVLTVVYEHLSPTITPEDIEELRTNPMFAVPDELLTRNGTVQLQNLFVPGPESAPEVSLLVLRPVGLAAGAPILYYMHGGGMIIGNNRTVAGGVLDWAVDIGAIVVSVEYRLAPEHPDPAPIEDCYAGLLGTHGLATEIGGDPNRIVVTGASAGGGFAAGLALLARDRGGPELLGQLLMCPMLDDRFLTPSSQELDGEGLWDTTSNMTGWNALLGERRGGSDVSIYTAPARATDLSGLPSSFIDVGSVETFRDEDIDYAARLLQAGVQTELHVWPGGFHGFDGIAPQAALSQTASATRSAWVRRLLAAG